MGVWRRLKAECRENQLNPVRVMYLTRPTAAADLRDKVYSVLAPLPESYRAGCRLGKLPTEIARPWLPNPIGYILTRWPPASAGLGRQDCQDLGCDFGEMPCNDRYLQP